MLVFFVLFVGITAFQTQAQTKKKVRKKELYFSWGYNIEWYTKSNVKINQPSLGNNYQFRNIKGHDNRGWDDGLFSKQISKTVDKKYPLEIYIGAENLTNYFQKNVILVADQPFSQYFDASMVWGPVSGRMFYAGLRLKIK